VVGSHRELEVVLGELTLRVLDVQDHSGVVDQRRQLLATSSETADERPNRLQVCKVQLHSTPTSRRDPYCAISPLQLHLIKIMFHIRGAGTRG